MNQKAGATHNGGKELEGGKNGRREGWGNEKEWKRWKKKERKHMII